MVEKEVNGNVSDISSAGIRVAVYGTLRSTLHNHYLLENSTLLGTDVIDSGYRMVSLGGFPAVLEASDALSTPITVEVYRIDDRVLDQLDGLEGHPEWYKRSKVPTKWKNAWLYVMPHEQGYSDHNPVDSGDWLDFITQTA